jgi:hypothetical protein
MKKMHLLLVVLVVFSFLLSGCYYFSANSEIKNAGKLVAELKAAGGDKSVPYDYCAAEKFLEASRIEFGQGDYKPAKELASRSVSAAQAGLAEVKKK